MSDGLATYLHDHLAGATVAINLLDALHAAHADESLGGFAAELRAEIEHEREMLRALADSGFTAVESFNRASMRAFEAALPRAAVVIMASGAPQAWARLPDGGGRRAFDLGSPLQVIDAPGWNLTALDELLDGQGAILPDAEYAALEAECTAGAEKICQTLLAPPPSDTLAAMTAMRAEFMQHKLPALLEGLPPQRARKLTSEVNAMLHEFIRTARREP